MHLSIAFFILLKKYFLINFLVHFKMKITPWFTHPQAILGVYDFLLSDEYNQSYINNHPDAP